MERPENDLQLPRQRRHVRVPCTCTKRMAVSKESTFPPILQSYCPGLKVTGRSPPYPSHCKRTARFPIKEEKRQMSKKGDVKETGLGKEKKSTALPLKDERELELKRRRAKKAMATLKHWDALLQEERDDKYATLQQRVRLQKQLISKNDHLIDLQRAKEEETKQERIRSRKEAHREMVETLRAHIRKVEEHKQRISEKLKEMEDEPTWHNITDVSQVTVDVEQSTEDEYMPHGQSTPNLEIYDATPSIETAWNGWKSDTIRKLRPIVAYSQQLKNQASPSAKRCLSVYEMPTVYDRHTGKAVPLTEVLSNMTHMKSEDPLSHKRGVMQQAARRNQTRASIMLARKDQSRILSKHDPGSYIENCEDTLSVETKSKPKDREQDYLERKCLSDISPKTRRKLPRFLTSSGSLVATSLEEVGEKVYYRHSKTSPTHASKSVFMTDLQLEDESPIPSKHKHVLNQTTWQPLSYTAVSEHRGTTELPVCGLGHLSHGRYKMWKPMQTAAS